MENGAVSSERMNFMNDSIHGLLGFIEKSPTCFHAVEQVRQTLLSNGFTELQEAKPWDLQPGKNYFVTRNQSSLIALRLPAGKAEAFRIVASHSDSPTFKIKENPEKESAGCIQLNTERYGGMLCASWFDRPLSIAGRVVIRTDSGKIQSRLVCCPRDLVLIPNLAIHMTRAVNEGYAYNPQTDMLPLYGGAGAKGTFLKEIAQVAGVDADAILCSDQFLYNRMKGTVWGAQNEFLCAPRLDDLECAYTSLCAFLSEGDCPDVPVYALFDNEEVGSGTKQGADSSFLETVLRRVIFSASDASAAVCAQERFCTALATSFMVSADNAHAVHPNHPDKTDPTNPVYLNGGVVVKFNANQKYTTDAVSGAIFQEICRRAGAPCQTFVNRSDIAGGSTLGNISNSHVSLNTVDIGLPQLAMHSCYETAGVQDVDAMIRALTAFYHTKIETLADGSYRLS